MVPFTFLVLGMQMSTEQRDPARSETSASLHGGLPQVGWKRSTMKKFI